MPNPMIAEKAIGLTEKVGDALKRRDRFEHRKDILRKAIIEQHDNIELKGRMVRQVSSRFLEQVADLPFHIVPEELHSKIGQVLRVIAQIRSEEFSSVISSIFLHQFIPPAQSIIKNLEIRRDLYSKRKWFWPFHKI